MPVFLFFDVIRYYQMVCHTIESVLCRDYNCDSTTIRLRSDYDASHTSASIRRDLTQAKMNMSVFRCSCIAVELNASRNFVHFHRSQMCRGVVVS